MRRPALLAAAAVAVLALVAVAVWRVPLLLRGDGGRTAATAFARAWVSGTLGAVRFDDASPDAAQRIAALTAGLTPSAQDRPAEVTVRRVRVDGDRSVADLHVRWELGATWQYETQLPLHRTGRRWLPVMMPTVVHPELTGGRTLRARTVPAPRAAVLDRHGHAIVAPRPVVTVGVEPSRTHDLATTVRTVARLTDVDPADLLRRSAAAKPDAFVEAVTLRREAYDAVRSRLRPVPGVVLRTGTRQLAPTAAFARALLGTVGPATAEVVQASAGRVRPDQEVGLSGLQRTFDAQLAGTPGVTVEAVGPSGIVLALQKTLPTAGRPLRLTLDPAVQEAADAALEAAPAGKRSALVVVQPGTGDVLAVANQGPDGPGVDRALTGRYPPGSTAKVASTLALLRAGLRPSDVVPCPATVTVWGKQFRNAEAEALGPQPFRTDFAQSCNTAFVGLAGRVSPAALTDAAHDLGTGTYDLGVPAFGGDVPADSDPVTHAAQLIGQGKVLASPLSVAVQAATVAAGRLHLPRLVEDGAPAAPGAALPQTADLRTLSRLVVTSGTGTALARVPGPPVIGKTGTAEYGTADPPRTHAWFAGSSGELAFAVLVEDGGFGGAVAAPLAARLLAGLPGR